MELISWVGHSSLTLFNVLIVSCNKYIKSDITPEITSQQAENF